MAEARYIRWARNRASRFPVTMLHSNRLPLLIACAFAAPAWSQDAETVVQRWMLERHTALGLTAEEASAYAVTDMHADRKGVSYVYIQQTVHGLPVLGAVANFAVRQGQVVGHGDRLQRGLTQRASVPQPALDAQEALRRAARELGLGEASPRALEERSPTELLLDGAGVSLDPIPARLAYAVGAEGAVLLCWELTIRAADAPNWWHLAVDASNGAIVHAMDRIVRCSHAPGAFGRPYSALSDLVRADAPPAPLPLDGSGYRVFPFPTESPAHGPQVLVSEPADVQASPFGWHDTDGVPGAEYTITRGNNVFAYEDADDDDQPGYSPDGGAALSFDFDYAPPQGPQDYLDASITNLFFACNALHDVLHRYGFDAASGNFQANNLDAGGEGNDEVIAQAQDGGGMNNANFGTPADGQSGRMQMYLWRAGIDSSLTVNAPATVAGVYVNALAGFGPPLPTEPLTAGLVLAEDGTAPVNNACEALTNAGAIAGSIAMVDRGQCTFISKVEALQAAGALAVIVVNNTAGDPIAMGGTGGQGIVIPSVMISQADGLLLKQALLNGPVNATLVGEDGEDLRDSGFDNGIIAHEYGHGVSNRLTGGPANVDCLWNEEQMGEGWSDYIGMVLTMQPGDAAAMPRGVGTFVRDQGPAGAGIRPAPYTTDLSVNPYTYGATNEGDLSQPHGVGFVWASMLWDLTWALVDEYGYDPDLYAGTGGNNLALQLVMDGMKLQPCNPGFVDGRDAILLADELLTGGQNACLIWHAFARRGLGLGADQGDSFSRFDQQEAFDVPNECLSTGLGALEGLSAFGLQPNPAGGRTELVLPRALRTDARLRVLGVDGRLWRTERIPAGTVRAVLDLAGLPPAVYVAELSVEGRVLTERLVVQ